MWLGRNINCAMVKLHGSTAPMSTRRTMSLTTMRCSISFTGRLRGTHRRNRGTSGVCRKVEYATKAQGIVNSSAKLISSSVPVGVSKSSVATVRETMLPSPRPLVS